MKRDNQDKKDPPVPAQPTLYYFKIKIFIALFIIISLLTTIFQKVNKQVVLQAKIKINTAYLNSLNSNLPTVQSEVKTHRLAKNERKEQTCAKMSYFEPNRATK